MLTVGDIDLTTPRPLASMVEETWGTEKAAAVEGNSKKELPV
jgi:hypothetical protein